MDVTEGKSLGSGALTEMIEPPVPIPVTVNCAMEGLSPITVPTWYPVPPAFTETDERT